MANDNLNIYQLIDDLERGAKALDKMLMFTDIKKLAESQTFVKILTNQVQTANKLAGILGIEIEKDKCPEHSNISHMRSLL